MAHQSVRLSYALLTARAASGGRRRGRWLFPEGIPRRTARPRRPLGLSGEERFAPNVLDIFILLPFSGG